MLLSKLSEIRSFTKTNTTKTSTISLAYSNLITKCVYQYLYRRPHHQHHQMKRHYASNHHHHHRILSSPVLGTGMLPLNAIYIAIAIVFITISNSQLASGALNSSVNNDSDNYNSINYMLSDRSSDNSSKRNVYKNLVDNYYFDDNNDWKSRIHSTSRLRRTPIYQNEFAVYVPSGSETADSIAAKYGFTNGGQVSLF